jgi:hypothetical protein
MANRSSSSIYEKLSITKGDTEVNLIGKVVGFDYYESLLSPNVTATIGFIDTGSTLKDESKNIFGTIYNTLPITGGEEIKFKIGPLKGSLFNNAATNPNQESQRESVVMSLISKEGIENFNIANSKKYNGNISDSVKKILQSSFNVKETNLDIDKTGNGYSFVGANDNPFELVTDLASMSTYAEGNPGFFFYQTREGFKYKAIDNLIKQEPKETYYYSGAMTSGIEDDHNNNKIISFSVKKNQNIVNAMKSGVYETRNIFTNPLTLEVTEFIFKIENNKLTTTLGRDIDYSPVKSNNYYSRTFSSMLDVGSFSSGIDVNINNDPREYLSKAAMRYNLLMSQKIDIMIPSNLNLVAGDVIRCEFEKLTDDKVISSFDINQSGNYLILDLCHHFDTKRSFTSLTLVRDSFGAYTNKNKK